MTKIQNNDEQNEVSTALNYQQYNTKRIDKQQELADISETLFARRPENDVDFKLDRVYEVLSLLGNPHKSIKCVHITGTNGKSSTTMMTDRLLSSAGIKTGCFTSPHIRNVTERILINGVDVEAEVFIDAYNKVINATEQIESTRPELGKLGFFEVITIIAFYIFASLELDVCVVEVGLGGLLDATNVIESPICSIITPIGIDHTDYLGDTIEQIAYQKAGIIKAGVPVIVANQSEEAMEVVRQVAKEKGAEIIMPQNCEHMQKVINGAADENYGDYTPQFIKDNLSLSLQAAFIALKFVGGDTDVANAFLLGRILGKYYGYITNLPGRFEQKYLRAGDNDYPLIFDVAHNPHGAAMLRSTIDNYSITHKFKNIYIIVGMFADKDAVGFFEALGNEVGGAKTHYIITQNSSPRALRADDLAVKLQSASGANDAQYTITDTVYEAIYYVRDNATSGGIILVTGSFTTVSDANNCIWLCCNGVSYELDPEYGLTSCECQNYKGKGVQRPRTRILRRISRRFQRLRRNNSRRHMNMPGNTLRCAGTLGVSAVDCEFLPTQE